VRRSSRAHHRRSNLKGEKMTIQIPKIGCITTSGRVEISKLYEITVIELGAKGTVFVPEQYHVITLESNEKIVVSNYDN
jgi:hypothetical protein